MPAVPLCAMVVADGRDAVTLRVDAADVLAAFPCVPAKKALYWWVPAPGMNWRTAVPALVSCAEPTRWSASQDVAVVSQRLI